ncbi:MAG: hypothetical protein ACF8GE_07495 [Phycisphaerales bacterium JB043]
MSDSSRGTGTELYVGYLPLPARHKRFLRIMVPTFLWILVVVSGVVVLGMREPGEAVWDTGQQRSWSGLLMMEPYPTLHTDDGAYLIVEMGKMGAHHRLVSHDGTMITVSGWRLQREARNMIELAPEEDAIQPADGLPTLARPSFVTAGQFELVGEIVDGKCFLGAMKPGDGKTHKACAVLCVSSGLPPLLATRNETGQTVMYLVELDGHVDGDYPRGFLDLIAEPVTIVGEIGSIGDLPLIRAGLDGIAPVGN